MSRPFKCRRIGYLPEVTFFKPAGVPLRMLEVVNLSFEEAEAIRLRDLEKLEQKPAAEKMNISRPTFQRILSSARQKLADALLNGKAIQVEGGNFEVFPHHSGCLKGHEWNISLEKQENNPPLRYPVCGTPELSPVPLPGEAPPERSGVTGTGSSHRRAVNLPAGSRREINTCPPDKNA